MEAIEISELKKMMCDMCIRRKGHCPGCATLIHLRNIAKEFEPVTHAHWQNQATYRATDEFITEEQCSKCERWNTRAANIMSNAYCPWCGAKMDEGGK